jgi:hypothetical protein
MLKALAAPTPPEEVGQLPGKGGSGALDYVTARFVQQRLDDAVGPENWASDFKLVDGQLVGGIGIISIVGENQALWVWKWDVGTESTIEKDKGRFSDAFKRAGVQWGIARDLYPGPKKTKARKPRAKKSTPSATESTTSTPEVVGEKNGLTDDQRRTLMGALTKAGLKAKRKSAVFLMCSKNSVKDMDTADYDRVLDIIHNPDQHAEVWDNINLVEADVKE